MRVDAHHHVWDLGVRDQPWTAELPRLRRSFSVEDLRPELAAHQIDATVVVQTIPTPDETPELLGLADNDLLVGGVVGWTDLTAPNVTDRLAALRNLPGGALLVGIRHNVQDEADPDWLQRPDVRQGLTALGRAGLVFDLLVTASQLDAALRVVRDLPDVRFALDHAGKPRIRDGVWEPWRTQISELAGLPNVAVKLSGLVTEAGDGWTLDTLKPYGDVILTEFGPKRTMFGSDWPVCLLAGSYGDVIEAAEALTADLALAERSSLFGETARHWYDLRWPRS